MNLFGLMETSGGAMQAERMRAEVVAANMANAETTRTEAGGPYHRQEVVFAANGGDAGFLNSMNTAAGNGTLGESAQASGPLVTIPSMSSGSVAPGVHIAQVIEDPSPPLRRYDPGHPDAGPDGYVAYPDINPLTEMVDLMGATRAYGLNGSAVQAEKGMIGSRARRAMALASMTASPPSSTSESSNSRPGINVPVGQVQSPQATTSLNMTANLDSESATGTQFPAQVTVYDSLGESHIAAVTYQQTANNTWTYSAALPAGDFTSGVSTPVTGTMTFDADGNLSTIQPTGAAAPSTVGTAAGDASTIALNFTGLADGANDLNMSWNLLGASGTPTISQVDTTSAVAATTQDGYASGQYQSFTIGADGTVTASYSNGQQQTVGQLALANVTNLQGLKLLGNGDYATTFASGSASVGVSGAAGLGTIQDGALEGSNVNISAEFSDLIIAQRAFEANAKSVTTFDTITQDTINMVH